MWGAFEVRNTDSELPGENALNIKVESTYLIHNVNIFKIKKFEKSNNVKPKNTGSTRFIATQSACPMCNLQVSRIKKRYTELTKNGMKIIQVFESTPAEIKR